MEKYQVSVIMPVYNCEQFLKDTVSSVLFQTYKNFELISVDDASTDSSPEILNKLAEKDNRIKVFHLEKNGGPAHTRNYALKQAKGRFIAFIDSDDIWFKDKLERQIDFMIKHNYALTYTAYQKIDETGHKKGVIRPKKSVNYKDILKSNHIACSTAVYDKDKVGNVEFPKIRKRQDMGLWLKIIEKTGKAHCLPDILCLYMVRTDSVSSNKAKAAGFQWKLYREVEKLGLLQSIYYFLNYMVRGFFKYLK